MAAGNVIPWTDPGGTPCCCENECFTDLTNSPVPFYAENRWQEITGAHYSQLLAGGTYSGSLSVYVQSQSVGWSDGITRGETHSVSVVGLDYLATNSNLCAYTAQTEDPITVQVSGYHGFNNSYSAGKLTFSRHLGSFDGKRWITLSTVTSSGLYYLLQLRSFFSSLWFGDNVTFYAANANSPADIAGCTHKKFTGASSIVRLKIGSTTYSESGGSVGCFATAVNMGFVTHSGYVLHEIVFTPSAP